MKRFKKVTTLLTLTLMLTLIIPNVLPITQTIQTAEASTIKINKKKVSLAVGKTIRLKISGTKKKVTWKSDKKQIATVSSSGKVTAKGDGSTTITATVSGKKYTCKVKVEKPADKNVTNAPFKAKAAKFGKVNIVVPMKWKLITNKDSDSYTGEVFPLSSATDSGIYLHLIKTGLDAPKYDVTKKILLETYTKEFLEEQLKDTSADVTVANIKDSDVETERGKILKLSYDTTMSAEGLKNATGASVSKEKKTAYKACFYIIYIDNYSFQVMSMDGDNADMGSVAEYIIKTFTVNK